VSGQLYAPATLSSEMKLSAHFMWGWVGPRAGLDVVEKWKISCPFWHSNFWRASPYPIRCLGSYGCERRICYGKLKVPWLILKDIT